MNFVAVGFNVTDESITENGKTELYVDRAGLQEACDSWLYYHQLHEGGATMSALGCGYCPRCGNYSIVKQKERNGGRFDYLVGALVKVSFSNGGQAFEVARGRVVNFVETPFYIELTKEEGSGCDFEVTVSLREDDKLELQQILDASKRS